MLSAVMKEAAIRAKVEPRLVTDIVVGNLLQIGAGEISARMAMLMAGFPIETSVMAINRLGISGIEVCAILAAKIKSGMIDIGMAAGV
jgi:acetyl-CoA acyltransferase 1